MTTKSLKSIEQCIARLKRAIANTGNMRPGTLSVQYRNPSERKMPFNQLSYTHQSKSRSEYIRWENLETILSEISAYKHFRKRVDELIDLSIQASKMRFAASGDAKLGRKPRKQQSRSALVSDRG